MRVPSWEFESPLRHHNKITSRPRHRGAFFSLAFAPLRELQTIRVHLCPSASQSRLCVRRVSRQDAKYAKKQAKEPHRAEIARGATGEHMMVLNELAHSHASAAPLGRSCLCALCVNSTQSAFICVLISPLRSLRLCVSSRESVSRIILHSLRAL